MGKHDLLCAGLQSRIDAALPSCPANHNRGPLISYAHLSLDSFHRTHCHRLSAGLWLHTRVICSTAVRRNPPPPGAISHQRGTSRQLGSRCTACSHKTPQCDNQVASRGTGVALPWVVTCSCSSCSHHTHTSSHREHLPVSPRPSPVTAVVRLCAGCVVVVAVQSHAPPCWGATQCWSHGPPADQGAPAHATHAELFRGAPSGRPERNTLLLG